MLSVSNSIFNDMARNEMKTVKNCAYLRLFEMTGRQMQAGISIRNLLREKGYVFVEEAAIVDLNMLERSHENAVEQMG